MRGHILGAASCVLLFGCSSLQPEKVAEETMRPLGQSYLLAAAAQPYAALHVEIDAVEGMTPSASDVAALQEFLTRYCAKPGGVRVVVDDIIPRAVARGRTVASLELQYLDGPPDEQAAFLYFLFYRSGASGVRDSTTNPYFMFTPFPAAVFVDRAYGGFFRFLGGRTFNRLLLLHEAGHAIGLVENLAHRKNGHCTSKRCLMQSPLYWQARRFLTGRDPWDGYRELCERCTADLADYSRAVPPDNQRFLGRYFVRSEPGYHVLSLPDLIYVHAGDLATLDRQALEEHRARAIAANVHTIEMKTSDIDISEMPKVASAMLRDHTEPVRELGAALINQGFEFAEEWRAVLETTLGDLLNPDLQQRILAEMTSPPQTSDPSATEASTLFLSDTQWLRAEVGWGQPARNRYFVHAHDVANRDWRDLLFLTLQGERFGKGLYAHSPSRYAFRLGGNWREFTARIGLRDGAAESGSAVFIVRGDGRELHRSKALRVGESERIAVDVAQVNELELLTQSGNGEDNSFAWAIWVEPRVSR